MPSTYQKASLKVMLGMFLEAQGHPYAFLLDNFILISFLHDILCSSCLDIKLMKAFSVKKYLRISLLIAISTATSLIVVDLIVQGNVDRQAIAQMDMKMHNMSGMSMDLGPADVSFDLRFLDGMIPHHQGAVVMAKSALQKSKRPEIKKLSAAIIKAQEKEIVKMSQWRKQWYPKASSTPMAWSQQMGHMMAMSKDQMQGMMMNVDLGAADAEFDLRFINAMIPHHEGALVMATDALNKTKRSEIKKLAQDILTSQKIEIAQMQQWRKAWYKK